MKHWFVRVGDGENFKNSRHPFWGVKRGSHNSTKSLISKMEKGDILWFINSKPYGGIVVGMAEFVCMYDRQDEPIININTFTNEEQNWKGDGDWDIQIHYDNLYDTELQKIKICIPYRSSILEYDKCIDILKQYYKKINNDFIDLDIHYKNFKYYAKISDKFN